MIIRSLLTAFIILNLIGSSILFIPSVASSSAQSIEVGVLFDLSGPNKAIGGAMLSGAEAAMRLLNSILKDKGISLDLVISDTQSNRTRLLIGAMNLVRKKGVDVIIGPSSPYLAKTLMAFSNAHHIPVILTANKYPLMPYPWNKDFKWLFSVSPDIRNMVKSFLMRLRQKGIQRIGLLIQDGAKGTYFNKDEGWIKAYSTEIGIDIECALGFKPTDTDCSYQLAHCREMGAQLVLYRGERSFFNVLASSLKMVQIPVGFLFDIYPERQFPAPVYVQYPVTLKGDKEGGGGAIDSINAIRFKNVMGIHDAAQDRYIAYSAVAWDAVFLLSGAVKKGYFSKRPVPEAIREGLERTRVNGVLGQYNMTPKYHSPLPKGALGIIVIR